MVADRSYALDANVFVEASRRYYAFDIAPAFWEGLVHHASIGKVVSIDRVGDELKRGNDDLASWVEAHDSLFLTTDDPNVLAAYRRIMTWVQRQDQFIDAAKAEFAAGADGWLVAYAWVQNLIVVTHEAFRPDARRKVHIPNVYRAFNVSYVNTFDMLRGLGFQFR